MLEGRSTLLNRTNSKYEFLAFKQAPRTAWAPVGIRVVRGKVVAHAQHVTSESYVYRVVIIIDPLQDLTKGGEPDYYLFMRSPCMRQGQELHLLASQRIASCASSREEPGQSFA